MSDYVYFIQAGESGPIKIGFSSDVNKRLSMLKTGNHEQLFILGSFQCDNARDIERDLHCEFAHLRLEGEWFKSDQRLLDLIAAWGLVRKSEDRDYSATHPRAEKLHCLIRSSDTRAEIGRGDWWVVEWSHAQGQCHVAPLIESLALAHQALLYGRMEPGDYVIVGICSDDTEAIELANKLEPWLRAVGHARKVNDTTTRRR